MIDAILNGQSSQKIQIISKNNKLHKYKTVYKPSMEESYSQVV